MRVTRIAVVLLTVVCLWGLVGCGGSGGGDNVFDFAFTPGTQAGQQYPGQYWPLIGDQVAEIIDTPHWWEYDTSGSLRWVAPGDTGTEPIDGEMWVDMTKTVDVNLDTGPRTASEYFIYVPSGVGVPGGGGGLPGTGVSARGAGSDITVLNATRFAILRALGRDDDLPSQMTDDLTKYYAKNAAGTRVEVVGVGDFMSGPTTLFDQPRTYLPVPLTAAAPRQYQYRKPFGMGSGADINELLEGDFTGNITYWQGVCGEEEVTVPAGEFTAVRIWERLDISVTDQASGGTATGHYTGRLWLAQNIGIVKETGDMHITATAPGEGTGTVDVDVKAKLTDHGSFATPAPPP